MGGEKKRGGKTPDWGGQIFQNFFEGGKTHFSPPFLDPCACMIHDVDCESQKLDILEYFILSGQMIFAS